jgi:hypothetical protein
VQIKFQECLLICTGHKMLLGRSNQEGWGGQKTCHGGESWEMHEILPSRNLTERIFSGDLGLDGKVKTWIWLNWLRKGSSGRLLETWASNLGWHKMQGIYWLCKLLPSSLCHGINLTPIFRVHRSCFEFSDFWVLSCRNSEKKRSNCSQSSSSSSSYKDWACWPVPRQLTCHVNPF